MIIILFLDNGDFGFIYIDDVVKFSQTTQEHISQTRLGLSLFKETAVTLKLEYCDITDNIDYQGHVICPSRLEAAKHTMYDIHDLRIWTTQTDRCSVIDLCNVVRWFVPSFTFLSCQVTARLRKSRYKSLGN